MLLNIISHLCHYRKIQSELIYVLKNRLNLLNLLQGPEPQVYHSNTTSMLIFFFKLHQVILVILVRVNHTLPQFINMHEDPQGHHLGTVIIERSTGKAVAQYIVHRME